MSLNNTEDDWKYVQFISCFIAHFILKSVDPVVSLCVVHSVCLHNDKNNTQKMDMYFNKNGKTCNFLM